MAYVRAKKKEFLLPERERGIFLGGEKLDMGNRTKGSILSRSAMLPEGDPGRGVFRAAAHTPGGKLVGSASGRVSPSIGGRPSDVGNLRTGVRTGVQAGAPQPTAPVTPASPTAASTTSPRPSVKKFSALNSVLTNRRKNPSRFEQLQRNPSIAKPSELVTYGIDPAKSRSRTTGGNSVAKTWARVQGEVARYNEEVSAAKQSDVDFARTQVKEEQKIEGRVDLAEVKGGIKEKLQGLKGEQRQAVLATQFKNDMAKFGITQAAKDAGREDDQVFQLDKLAEQYRLAGENAATNDERDQAGRLELEALRAANEARPKVKESTYFDKEGNVAGSIKQETRVEAGADAGFVDINNDGKTADEVAQYNFLKETLAAGVHPRTGKPLTPAEIDRANATLKRLKPSVIGE